MSDGAEIQLRLTITDPELCAELAEHPEEQERCEFAIRAMKIGALALRQAQGRIDVEQVRREGSRLINDLAQKLEGYQREMTGQISNKLTEYFAPESGRFDQRVQRLIKNDGELEQLLRRQIGNNGSELAKTLAAHVGENSQLMQTLNPDANSGIISSLARATEQTLSNQREQILNEFSLDNADSALSRLVNELKKSNGDLMGEFSLDRENSALSRLVSRVDEARLQISSQFSLDEEGSALARMRKELIEVLETQSKSNNEFQADVQTKLAEMTVRREEAHRSTRHGVEFEEAVFGFINERSQKAGHIATHTGNIAGSISRSRVGDVVIEMGPEHAAAGACIVIEAKEDRSYTLAKARQELDTARKNRDASVGLFVMSKCTAPDGLEPFGRYGNDIVLIWDKDNPASDVVFDAGLSVATALCVRAKAHTDEVGADFEAIEAAVRVIEQQIKNLEDIDNAARLIQDHSSNIRRNVQKTRDLLNNQIDILDEKVGELRVVLGDVSDIASAA